MISHAARLKPELERHLQDHGISYQSIQLGMDEGSGAPAFFLNLDRENRDKLSAQKPFFKSIIVKPREEVHYGRQGNLDTISGRCRPLVCGAAIYAGDHGTLGCFVKTADGRPALVSTAHVLFEQALTFEKTQVYQPSRVKDTSAAYSAQDNCIATAEHGVRLSTIALNRFDIGYAVLLPDVEFVPCFSPHLQLSSPRRLADPDYNILGQDVLVVGASSVLSGRVEAIAMTISIKFGSENLSFENLFVVTDFSNDADPGRISGALVVAKDGTVLGMSFASARGDRDRFFLFAYPLAPAFDELRCSLITF